jgi:hypothetical protein
MLEKFGAKERRMLSSLKRILPPVQILKIGITGIALRSAHIT